MSLLGHALIGTLRLSPLGVVQAAGRAMLKKRRRALDAALADPRAAQRARLLTLIGDAVDTEFGRAHGFDNIKDVEAFRRQIPLSTWDDYAPVVDRLLTGEHNLLTKERATFFGSSSGTTGRRKLIPLTDAFIEEFKNGSVILALTMLEKMPEAIRGKALMMHSPKVEELAPGIFAGSITAKLRRAPAKGNPLDAVPPEVFLISDFQTRYFLCLRFALVEKLTLVTAVNPSTVLLYAQTFQRRLGELVDAWTTGALGPDDLVLDDDVRAALTKKAKAAPKLVAKLGALDTPKIKDALPHLVGLCCWQGGNAPWYLRGLREHYGEVPILDYGYAATEGCFGAPRDVNTASSVLIPHGHFLEFMPEAEADACRRGEVQPKLMHELELGQRYVVVVTSGAGLYRYDMNDVVEVTGKVAETPTVVFRHKGGTMSSVTGEKLGESHVVTAMKDIAPVDLVNFCVAPLLPDGFPAGDAPPRYLLALELDDEVDLHALGGRFDRALMEANEEYEAKRGSLRLGPVEVVRLPRGATERLRAARVKAGAPDAHVKVPHVSATGEVLVGLGLEDVAPELAAQLPVSRA